MAVTPPPFDAEEFWEDLLAFIDERRVIPVVGTELLTVQDEGRSVPLYRAVATRLLKKYGATAPVDDPRLNDAVCALAASGRRVQDLYRPVNDILRTLAAEQTDLPPALHELASIEAFDLFVTSTPDDLLARTLDAVRFGGAPQTDRIEYAPGLSSDKLRDIPETRSTGYTAVFYLFGKACAAPLYAIHDEDTLEFVHTLQSHGHVPERLFSEFQSRNLLLIGCNFADWLSRFFIRLSNSTRLSSGDRIKKEFLVDGEASRDQSLTFFLERFSQNTRRYPAGPPEFVTELVQRWRARHPVTAPAAAPSPEQSVASGSIFVSYCSEDIGPARALFNGVQALGGDVAWFDKTALRPGDDWHQHILGAIQRCSLFLALVSANTERRTDGYFRREWDEAAERSRRIQGRKFIYPIVVDPNYAGDMARYALVPSRFQTFQYSHAPAGEMPDALKTDLVEQLRALRRARAG